MNNYRDILNQEFDSRKNLNKMYSLRAYARDLEIPASNLCCILSGKRGMSVEKSYEVACKLGLKGNEKDLFITLVEKEHARRKVERLRAEKLLQTSLKYNQIDNFSFDLISNWYYFAILAAMDLHHYDGSQLFLSEHLSLDKEIVKEALATLLKIKLIIKEDGHYKLQAFNLRTDTDFPSMALRNSHKQSLKQAIDSIDEFEVEDRDITSMTMAIDKRKIAEAKKRITKFRRELCEFLESGEKNAVYNLNIQLHPLTNKDQLR